jgi:hypothetical protein
LMPRPKRSKEMPRPMHLLSRNYRPPYIVSR